MTPCEICGLTVYRLYQGDDWYGTCHRQDPSDAYPHVIACLQRGYEREKSRAEALAAKMPRLRPISESPPDPSAPVLVAMANGTWKMSWLDIETLDGSRQGGSMPLGWMPLPEHPGTTGASP